MVENPTNMAQKWTSRLMNRTAEVNNRGDDAIRPLGGAAGRMLDRATAPHSLLSRLPLLNSYNVRYRCTLGDIVKHNFKIILLIYFFVS